MRNKILAVVVVATGFCVLGLTFTGRTEGKAAVTAQNARPVVFSAHLTASQEAPNPPTSAGIGAGVFVLSADHTHLDYAFSFAGLTSPVILAHFHNASFGSSGGVVRTICSGACPAAGTLITGTWASTDSEPLTSAMVTALLQGQIYVNVHTANFGGGEIRGQVIPLSVP
jgi:hypothetical protein